MEKLRLKTRPVWLQSPILFSPLCMGPRAATLLFAEMETWLHFQAPKFRSELYSLAHILPIAEALLSSSDITGASWAGGMSQCPQKSLQMHPSHGSSQNKVAPFLPFYC